MPNLNLKPVITAQLAELELGGFAHLAPQIEAEIETAAEAAVRKLVGPGCDRVLREARKKTRKAKEPDDANGAG
jgi:hypothetical protein